MPELPEVETVVRTLEKQIQDDTIIDLEIYYNRIIGSDVVSFKQNLIGKIPIYIKNNSFYHW